MAKLLAESYHIGKVSRVAAYVKAGSRYEPDHLPGISHFVRASAGLTTKESSIFGITRHIERHGASFKVSLDREYLIYRIDCLRDRLEHVIKFIDDTLHKPEFRPWEIYDIVQPRLKYELTAYKKNQHLVANEAMHKAAFRGGLAHSLFTPEHQIEKIKNKDLFEYLENNFVLDRMTFVGSGIHNDELKALVDGFSLNTSQYNGVSGATRYVGGEARIQAGFPHTLVNFVVQGSSIGDLKSSAALEVISSLIGTNEHPVVKYGNGPEKTLDNTLKSLSPAIRASIININYTDTGLFGISLLGPNEHLREATKSAVKHVRKILNNVSDSDLKSAKSKAKTRALISSENQELVYNVLGRRNAAGVRQSPIDHLDGLTLKDVQAVAKNLLASKPTLVSVGNPRYVPYVDELDA